MEDFSVKIKTGNPVSRATRRPGIPSPLVIFGKAADSLRWFSSQKTRLVQSRLAVNSSIVYKPNLAFVKSKALLTRQCHLQQHLRPLGWLMNILTIFLSAITCRALKSEKRKTKSEKLRKGINWGNRF